MRLSLLFLLLLFLCGVQHPAAQYLPIGDPMEQYYRFLYPEDAPSYNIRPVTFENHQSSIENRGHPWQEHPFFTQPSNSIVGLYTPELKTTWNSAFPSGQNDGALWQGRGLNTAVSLGGYFDYGPLKISLRPEFVYSQNRDFEPSPFSVSSRLTEYATPMRPYDVIQRFGENPVSRFDWGNSSVELQLHGFAAGFTNRNVWTGPAVQNPILFSNNAPGFLHGFIGTHRPVNTAIGQFEGQLIWGGLQESEYYDRNSSNNLRYLNAVMVNYSPSFIPGFHLGVSRFFMKVFPEDGLTISDILFVGSSVIKETFQTEENITGDDEGYQIATAFARWEFPSAGMEIYGEYGKNDHFLNTRHVFVNTIHARAFLLGGSKRWEIPQHKWITLNVEITQLSYPRPNNNIAGYYTNSAVLHGFTHKGQLLGAGTDSGSFSQLIKLHFVDDWGRVGISFNRIDLQIDRLKSTFNTINNFQDGSWNLYELIETEHRWGVHGLVFLPHHLELQANLYQSRFYNRHNLRGNDVSNTNIEITLRVQLPGWRR